MPVYDFKTLSPADFELLVRDLLVAEHGWRLEAFGHGRDGGIDLRGYVNESKLVVQCKHYAGSSFSDLRSAARSEVEKIKKEAPQRYIFATSQVLSRTQKDKLMGDLSGALQSSDDLLTGIDLNELLSRHPQVERQHFKLWLASIEILERIVRSGLWARSEAMMEDIRDRVKLYVHNPGFQQASNLLNQNNVVVITGAPGVGKSMLAEMILLDYWHAGWQVIPISHDIEGAWNSFLPGTSQIFFCDDFLGQTDISERGRVNEDSSLVRFMDLIAKNPDKRLILTTRSQVLQQASLRSEHIARGDFDLRQCVIGVFNYGPTERARILYNHLYFSPQPRDIIRDYAKSKHYFEIVRHPNFSPRIVEQVLRRPAISSEKLASDLIKALDRPIALWGTMFSQALSEIAQRLVLTIATFPTGGVEPGKLRAIVRGSVSPIEYTNALRPLEGTFVSILQEPRGPRTSVVLADPSVRDFVLALLDSEPEFVIELISHAKDPVQIGTLMKYACAMENSIRKFPGMAQVITNNEDFIISRIRTFMEQYDRVTERDGIIYLNTIASTLIDLLGPAQNLMPRSYHGLLDVVIEFVIGDHGIAPTNSVADLTERVLLQRESLPSWKEILRELMTHWANGLDHAYEVSKFVDFIDINEAVLDRCLELRQFARDVALRVLPDDLASINDNRSIEEFDVEWIDDIENAAAKAGVLKDLRDAIGRERQNTADHYAESSYSFDSDPSPTSGPGYSGFSGASREMDSEIDDLFGNLS